MKAIYLDQAFYEAIFQRCRERDRSSYPVLGVVASLRYKSPILVVSLGELDSLTRELNALERAGCEHPQIADFRQVCAKAAAEDFNLTISGDMFPEL